MLTTLLLAALPLVAQTWHPSLIGQPDRWSDRMNDPVVAADAGALRVEIAPDRAWGIAAVPAVHLPPNVAAVRVTVRAKSPSARWLMRLYGDLYNTGRLTTVGPFGGEDSVGVSEIPVDPRQANLAHDPPVQVQLGLEGQPGDWVVFKALEFVTEPPAPGATPIPGQESLATVDLLPNCPSPFHMRDWRAHAVALDRYLFDFGASGEYLPLIWLDEAGRNSPEPTFGLPSYVGDASCVGENHEGITCMGAVLGASLVGVDKRAGEHDFVRMCEAYYNTANGQNLVLNRTSTGTGGSFWYELWPHVLFYALADRYPGHGRSDQIMHDTAVRWADCCDTLKGPDGGADFDYTAFDFGTMKPVFNGQWREPDAAAAVAWLEYAAWNRYHEPRFLESAEAAMGSLQQRQTNPYYEVLLPWGAQVAARMNAELGRDYDLRKLIEWSFGISECRGGWAVTVGNWGGYDVGGLLGSVDNRGGYAFAMNTYAQAAALVPVARYQPQWAHALGKWMLNLANNARLFFPRELPAENQSSAAWKGDPYGLIGYEGLRANWHGVSPYATGDPVVMNWGPKTDLGIYGSSHLGLLAALVNPTSDPRILALDCLATDFFRAAAYPTYLLYNPHPAPATFSLSTGEARCDVYDLVSSAYLARGAEGSAVLSLPADRAAVVVLIPAGLPLEVRNGRLMAGGTVVGYQPPSPPADRVWVGPMAFVEGREVRPDFASTLTDHGQWPEVLARTQVFKTYLMVAPPDLLPGKSVLELPDEQLRALTGLLRERGVKVAFEVGGLRRYGGGKPVRGQWGKSVAASEFKYLKRWLDAGGTIDYLTTDHALMANFGHQSYTGDECGMTLAEGMQELADYYVEMQRLIPGVKVGAIESLGFFHVTGPDGREYPRTVPMLPVWPFGELFDQLLATLGRAGVALDHFHIDFGYEGVRHDGGAGGAPGLDYGRVLGVERYVRSKGVKAGVIVNAFHDTSVERPDPAVAGREARERTLAFFEGYVAAGGNAEHLVLQSWQPYPERTGPESDPTTNLGLYRELVTSPAFARLVGP